MIGTDVSARFPAWLRGLGWVAFGILALATLLVATRWLVMSSGHRKAQGITSARKKMHAHPHAGTSFPAGPAGVKVPGIPLSAVPHFGTVLTGDSEEWWEFNKQLDEIWAFLSRRETHPEQVNGSRSFRAVLQNMGVAISETMTEEEAAREYLKQADRFSDLLARWREAVSEGPLHESVDNGPESPTWRFTSMSGKFFELLAITTEARLQSGDAPGAWEDWLAMLNSKTRHTELCRPHNGREGYMRPMIFGLARRGMRLGVWTDEQMAGISSAVAQQSALADMREIQAERKKQITRYYANFNDNKSSFSKDFMNTPSPFDRVVNQVKLKLITDQQIRDNMDMELADVDRMLDRFDPETGLYLRTPEDDPESPASGGNPAAHGSFYFMMKDLNSPEDGVREVARSMSGKVVREQSGNDQFRLALALESYRRKTGTYPDHLENIGNQFPDGPPVDIATGQPYFYRKDPGEGYTLWGTGIDGKSDGGDVSDDVTWKHRPVKAE